MAADSVCRRHVLRRGLHASDRGAERYGSHGASLILSLESVVSVLAGWALLHQHLSVRELLGCVVMFAAIILAQLPEKQKNKQ